MSKSDKFDKLVEKRQVCRYGKRFTENTLQQTHNYFLEPIFFGGSILKILVIYVRLATKALLNNHLYQAILKFVS